MTTIRIVNKKIRGGNLIELLKAKIENPYQFFSIKLEITPLDKNDTKKEGVEYEQNKA
ncbi:MAG: hypothetical protein JRJ44_02070 [Deltaproteobacteria bacterium]|nr:hypothetical protein [Deltaproteobacteria bacterium]